jgi:hypothetical protein
VVFDTVLSIDGLSALAIAENLALATLFIVLLRRALRFGVVTPEAISATARGRTLFTVGSAGGFTAAAIGVHLLAALLFFLGAYAQSAHSRIGFGFLVLSSGLLLALGFGAYGLSVTMPLDVVVDAFGVTFAGAAVPWRDVTGVERRRLYPGAMGKQEIILHSQDGIIRLGPGPAPTMDALAHAIHVGLSSYPVT